MHTQDSENDGNLTDSAVLSSGRVYTSYISVDSLVDCEKYQSCTIYCFHSFYPNHRRIFRRLELGIGPGFQLKSSLFWMKLDTISKEIVNPEYDETYLCNPHKLDSSTSKRTIITHLEKQNSLAKVDCWHTWGHIYLRNTIRCS